MIYSYDDIGKLTISVTQRDVHHAVNVEYTRPAGRALTSHEVGFVHKEINTDLLVAAYNSSDDAHNVDDFFAVALAENSLHDQMYAIVDAMSIK